MYRRLVDAETSSVDGIVPGIIDFGQSGYFREIFSRVAYACFKLSQPMSRKLVKAISAKNGQGIYFLYRETL